MRAMPRAATAAALALLVGLGGAAGAGAAPGPSDGDVDRAQAAVAGAASAVAQIELDLAVQQQELASAWTAVDAAGEAYTQAIVDRDAAEAASLDAAARLEEANRLQEVARAELGTIALEAYRSGGSMDGMSALLSADGLEDYAARSAAIDRLGRRAEGAVQRFEAAQVVASTLQVRATAAADEARTAATAAEDALDAAGAAQSAAEAKVEEVEQQRTVLIAELAERRQTSVEVERARQDALDAERIARADAAALSAHTSAEPSVVTVSDPVPTSSPAPTPTSSASPSATPTPSSSPSPSPSATPTPTATPSATPTPTATTAPVADAYGLGTGTQRGSAAQGQAAVNWAVAQVGKPYLWGGTGPDAFDCSGLTSQAWLAAGVGISRTSRDQYRSVLKVSYSSMRAGDLIFWGSNPSDPSSITHVAMYIGGNQMVEASRPGVPLRVTTVRWSGTMPYAGRP
ncbi:C40 family peptidase [Actinotalea sp.]|uniref:C40 family peptidase n=1 Tax=Actinotalea sp. TaxID=1872145 RepID=UPI0035679FBC